jgi:hypothetical protein
MTNFGRLVPSKRRYKHAVEVNKLDTAISHYDVPVLKVSMGDILAFQPLD